jgi:flagellar basal-body rod protein FlgC
MDMSASGLTSERLRMEIIAENIANIDTTRSGNSGPYRRKMVVFHEVLDKEVYRINNKGLFPGRGVKVTRIIEDDALPLVAYDPEHPDANEEGLVMKPNINLADEMVDLITASRSYSANVTVLNTTKAVAIKALTIGRG